MSVKFLVPKISESPTYRRATLWLDENWHYWPWIFAGIVAIVTAGIYAMGLGIEDVDAIVP